MKRLRIVHVVPGLARGGAETLLYNLATHPSDIEHRIISLGRFLRPIPNCSMRAELPPNVVRDPDAQAVSPV